VLGAEHPDTLISMNALGQVFWNEGNYAQAEAVFTRTIEAWSRGLGETHPYALMAMNNLGAVYRSEGKNAQAEVQLSRTLEIRRRVSGAEHPDTLTVRHNLALVYQNEGKFERAEALFNEVEDARRRVLGSAHPDTLRTQSALARVRLQQRKYAQAEAPLRDAWNKYQSTSPDVWQRFNCQSLLGASLAGQKKFAEAEPLLLAAYSALDQRTAVIPAEERFSLEEARNAVLQLYRAWEKPVKVAEWRQKLAVAPVTAAQSR